jgi:hypothetical protein
LNRERRATILWQQSIHYIRNLNFFASRPPSIDEHTLHTQRISTRLFIVLLTGAMTILLLYTSLIRITKTVNIESPSFEQYSHLYLTYSRSLTCPCSKISINYGKFIHVEYTLHQVCSSIFVDQSWINFLAKNAGTRNMFWEVEFRHSSPHTFQALKTFCELINKTISDSLTQFYSNQYVSASIIHQELFEPETESLVHQFQLSTNHSFLLSLSMI